MKILTTIFCALILCAAAPGVRAQTLESVRGSNSDLVLTLAGGLARYVMPHEAPFEIDRNGAVFSARLLWHPDHRLCMGVESGWTRFYTYDRTAVETDFGVTDASLSLSAIPALAVFSMEIHRNITLYAGAGGYFVRSHATSFGTTVDVTRFSQGWMAAASWDYTLSGHLQIGMEMKWYGATEFGDGVVVAQLHVPVRLTNW